MWPSGKLLSATVSDLATGILASRFLRPPPVHGPWSLTPLFPWAPLERLTFWPLTLGSCPMPVSTFFPWLSFLHFAAILGSLHVSLTLWLICLQILGRRKSACNYSNLIQRTSTTEVINPCLPVEFSVLLSPTPGYTFSCCNKPKARAFKCREQLM